MDKQQIPSFVNPQDRYKVYQKFRGVDLLTDETQIDDSRSPWAVNLISDAGGYPEKRLGWRTLHQFAGRVNGIWPFTQDGTDQMIVHAGGSLIRLDGDTETTLIAGIKDDRSTGFCFKGDLWVLTGAELLHYDGATAKNVKDEAYIPTTTIGAAPTGGG